MAIEHLLKLKELFLKDREATKAQSTIYKNTDHLNQFLEWCEENRLQMIHQLEGEHLLEYKFYLRDDPDKQDSTIGNHFSTLRAFFKFCEGLGAATDEQRLYQTLQGFDFAKGDLSRDDMMEFDQAKLLLNYLQKFEYAKVRHVMFVLFWHTGCRKSALRSLDLEDYEPAKQREHGTYALLNFYHRPETGTGLKNGEKSERQIIIWPEYAEVIEDYINVHRKDVADEYGRNPLITSPNGRYSKGAITNNIYCITRPCWYGQPCPHDRDPETCESVPYAKAATCPDSQSPHPLRRTAITYHLEEKNWTYEGASGRFDVQVKTLKEHYDQSTTDGQRKTRAAQFFDGDSHAL